VHLVTTSGEIFAQQPHMRLNPSATERIGMEQLSESHVRCKRAVW
jgi:hypothetical protein